MDDTISRQDAIDVLAHGKEVLCHVLDDVEVVGKTREKFFWELGLLESCINAIKVLPSAQPEIIRCKDCKWFNRSDGCSFSTAENGFCSWAERRTDETD